jgi:hypothetical protein
MKRSARNPAKIAAVASAVERGRRGQPEREHFERQRNGHQQPDLRPGGEANDHPRHTVRSPGLWQYLARDDGEHDTCRNVLSDEHSVSEATRRR